MFEQIQRQQFLAWQMQREQMQREQIARLNAEQAQRNLEQARRNLWIMVFLLVNMLFVGIAMIAKAWR